MRKRTTIYTIKTLCFFPLLCLFITLGGCSENGWHNASRESAGIAPDPNVTQKAVLQIYGADAWGWKGWFAIHTWITAKKTGEQSYTVYDVVGWRARHGMSVLRIRQDLPDRFWFGAEPSIIKEYRGNGVDQLIDEVDEAARTYPWKTLYRAFPGPNSNTFTAWVGKHVPELKLTLPFSAIGSSYANRSVD